MRHVARWFLILCTSLFLGGCAGGWRGGEVPAEWAGSPPPAKPATAAGGAAMGPRVSAEGVVFTYRGDGASVALAGEFNGWNTSADPMRKGADGTWTITKALPPGRYPYKFVIDGGTWKEDPSAKEFVDDGFGGKNSILEVGANGAAAPGVAPPATPAPVAAVTGKPRAPQVDADGVTFTYAGPARSVALCGDFNQWTPNADPMTLQPDGTWTARRKLPTGSWSYKFLVDGAMWKSDEANPVSKDDGFGGKNSVVVVK